MLQAQPAARHPRLLPASNTLPTSTHATPATPSPQLSLVLDDRDTLLRHLGRLMAPDALAALLRDMHIAGGGEPSGGSGGEDDGGSGGGGE